MRFFSSIPKLIKPIFIFSIALSIAQTGLTQGLNSKFSEHDLVFDGSTLKIYATEKICNNSVEYFVVSDAVLSKRLIESTQIQVGPINAAHAAKQEKCVANNLRGPKLAREIISSHTFNHTIRFYVPGFKEEYASGKFQAKGFKLTTNVSVLKYSSSLPEVDRQDSKLAQVIDEINSLLQNPHTPTSVLEHIHTQASKILQDLCVPNSPLTASGFTPRWEKGKCAVRTKDDGTLFGNTFMYGWSVLAKVESCADDMSSCDYSIQFICNAYEHGGGWTELCRIPRNQRGTPVQRGTIKLK